MNGILIVSPTDLGDVPRSWAEETASAARVWEENFLRIDPTKIVDACGRTGVGVVCLGPDLPPELLISIAEAFDRERPDLCVVLLAPPTTDLWEAALRAGVREIVPPDADHVAIGSALRRAAQVANRRQAALSGAVMDSETTVSRVVTVVSPKGGSGKTTIATNLAVGISRIRPGQAVIVDLDLQFGDVAAALQLDPEQTMADVANAPSGLDTTMLKVFLSPHPSGVFALCAPDTPAAADDISVGRAVTAIELLRTEFPFIIIDTGAGITEHTLAAMELSTDIVFVGAMDVASVRSLRKELDVMDQLDLSGARRHFVLNRADDKVGMEVRDIETMLGMSVDVSVPSSRLVPLSSNEGRPLLEDATTRSPVNRAFEEIVDRFVERPKPHGGTPTLSRWLRKETR